jgi:hypothetical protein
MDAAPFFALGRGLGAGSLKCALADQKMWAILAVSV